jgi:hypothetical protein
MMKLAIGNFCYQIFLSAPAEKQNLSVSVTPFFYLYDKSPNAAAQSFMDDMGSTSSTRNEGVNVVLRVCGPVRKGRIGDNEDS